MKYLIPLILTAFGAPALAQSTADQPQSLISPEYVKAADEASADYKTCLTEHATELAKKNKAVAPDLLIRAAKSKCQEEAGILAMWRPDATAKLIEDEVLATLLEHQR